MGGWRTASVKMQHEPAAEAEGKCCIFTRAVSELPIWLMYIEPYFSLKMHAKRVYRHRKCPENQLR